MKNRTWIAGAAAVAAGVGAVVAYKLLSKDIPAGATAVKPFDMGRYLGKWNEIARLPNSFEKSIDNLTEEYLSADKGMYKVITKGYNFKSGEWKEFLGKIKFAGDLNVGMLKVSYFGPFYANYNLLDIDENYQHALVSGSGLSYLWILSRAQAIPDDIKARFLYKAAKLGFIIEQLQWV